MKVRLTDIPSEGLNIKDTIPLSALNDRMDEGPGNDIHFLTDPQVELSVTPQKGGFEILGSIGSRYRQPCARCLEEVEHPIDIDLNLFLKPKDLATPRSNKEEALDNDDIGIHYFTGEHIDLEDLIQETLILSLNPFNSDHQDCPGLELISKEEEEGSKNTLKDLFKRAGI